MANPDVTNNMHTSSVLVSDMVASYLREKLLSLAEKNTIFYELGDKEPLPEGNSKTIQFTRYERLSLPTSPLIEGETPSSMYLTTSVIQAVVEQWGAVVTLTDVAEMTINHPAMRIAQQRLSTQHDETVDREIQRTLAGTSNATFANGRASRATLVAGDVLTTDDLRRLLANLRQQGAVPFDGSHYVGVFDPYVEMDITKDATFKDAAVYQDMRPLLNGEVGTWMGVRWKRSNNIPSITAISSGLTWAAQTTLASFTGFTASSTVYGKVTKLDPMTGAEVYIQNATSVTNGAAFMAQITIASATSGAGTYNIYLTMEAGAAATATFQHRVVADGASSYVVTIAKAVGTGTIVTTGTARALAVVGTGMLAPPDASAAGAVHLTYIFGKEAFGVVNLGGLKTTITPSTPSDSDPLVQRRKAGWKQLFKAVIKNPDFFRRIESLSTYG